LGNHCWKRKRTGKQGTMELDFNFGFFFPAELPSEAEVGLALLELSLNDPDYESVSREVKKVAFFSPSRQTSAKNPRPDQTGHRGN
jgi:hypothetical protein